LVTVEGEEKKWDVFFVSAHGDVMREGHVNRLGAKGKKKCWEKEREYSYCTSE